MKMVGVFVFHNPILIYFLSCILLPPSQKVCSANDGSAEFHRLNDVECVLYLMDIELTSVPVTEIVINETDLRSREKIWTCELVTDESHGFLDKLEIKNEQINDLIDEQGAVSGKTSILFRKAVISGEDFADLNINIDDVVEIVRIPEGDRRLKNNRRLSSWTTGEMETLVVRVKARDGAEPPDPDVLFNDIFDNDASFKTQYEACSYGQLTIKEYKGDKGVETVRPGIINAVIDIDVHGTSRHHLTNKAYKKVEKMFGDNLARLFDFVLFCMPPGTEGWLGFAYVNSWDSYYNGVWCQSLSAKMHEVGHNLGLAHAGTELSQYDDITGIMGFSFPEDNGPVMCFNAPNNWQLGWYSSQQISINPLTDLSAGGQTFTLIGVDDYTGDNSVGKYVAIRLKRLNSHGDVYIGFNKASGINSGTMRSQNMVIITNKDDGPNDSYESLLKAELTEGGSYALENFDSSRIDVEIKFVSLSSDMTDAVIEVTNSNEGPCDNLFGIKLQMDTFPSDISWIVRDSNGAIVDTSPEYTTAFALEQDTICLTSGIYTFEITDSFGDGICCGEYGNGYYEGYINGERIPGFGGGYFEWFESKTFSVGGTTLSSVQTSSCQNEMKGRFRWKDTREKKSYRKCKYIAMRGKCDMPYKDQPIWKVCRRSCNKCRKEETEIESDPIEQQQPGGNTQVPNIVYV